jgi:hypothetical protein
MWYSPRRQLPWSDCNAGYTDVTSDDSCGLASPHARFDNQPPGVKSVPYRQWFDSGWTGVSPPFYNTRFPMNLNQWPAPSPYEHPYDIPPIQHSAHNMYEPSNLPALGSGSHYDASKIHYTVDLYPDLPLGKGIVSGMNSAVAGKPPHYSACLRGTEYASRSRRFGYVSSAGTFTSEKMEERE